MQDKNIILVGFGAAGKTTIGRYLSQRLKKSFFDVDEEIIKEVGCHQDFFIKENGWDKFREIEVGVVERLSQEKGAIISTGGGTLLTEANRYHFSNSGVSFYLKTSLQELYERIQLRTDRPIASQWDYEEMKQKFNEREPFYEDCNVTVDVGGASPFEASERILNTIYEIGFASLSYEFWFRSTYKPLIENERLNSFVRPGNRMYPQPKSVQESEAALIRVLSEPGTLVSLPKFDEYTASVEVETVVVKKINELTENDFRGASPDASSPEAIVFQLGLIYNRPISLDEEVTAYTIRYL